MHNQEALAGLSNQFEQQVHTATKERTGYKPKQKIGCEENKVHNVKIDSLPY